MFRLSPENVTAPMFCEYVPLLAGFSLSGLGFHVPEMRWYVDDILFSTQNSWSTTGAPYPAPFDGNFYILLNVAVGGNFPGAPNSSTVFPVELEVHYERVYGSAP